MSLSERQETQAIAMEADRQVGLQAREQQEIGQLTNLLSMALLPGAFGLFAILKAGLDSASVVSKASMLQASDVAQKSQSSGLLSSLSKGNKPTIIFRKPADTKVNAKIKIDFLKQQTNRINFKGDKVAIRPSNDTVRRGRNKVDVKNARDRQDFRANLRLKPQTNLSQNSNINNAQAELKKEKQGLLPTHFTTPKYPRPNGMVA